MPSKMRPMWPWPQITTFCPSSVCRPEWSGSAAEAQSGVGLSIAERGRPRRAEPASAPPHAPPRRGHAGGWRCRVPPPPADAAARGRSGRQGQHPLQPRRLPAGARGCRRGHPQHHAVGGPIGGTCSVRVKVEVHAGYAVFIVAGKGAECGQVGQQNAHGENLMEPRRSERRVRGETCRNRHSVTGNFHMHVGTARDARRAAHLAEAAGQKGTLSAAIVPEGGQADPRERKGTFLESPAQQGRHGFPPVPLTPQRRHSRSSRPESPWWECWAGGAAYRTVPRCRSGRRVRSARRSPRVRRFVLRPASRAGTTIRAV